MLPASAVRVPEHTAPSVNQQIRHTTGENIARYIIGTRDINARLIELDREWDIERALEMNASALSLLGVALGALSRKRWLLLPAAVMGFLMLHALQGWCPPLPVFRRLGLRTRAEIDRERYALKMLRGDFRNLPNRNKPAVEQAEELLRMQER
jgi:hypothetical protein